MNARLTEMCFSMCLRDICFSLELVASSSAFWMSLEDKLEILSSS